MGGKTNNSNPGDNHKNGNTPVKTSGTDSGDQKSHVRRKKDGALLLGGNDPVQKATSTMFNIDSRKVFSTTITTNSKRVGPS